MFYTADFEEMSRLATAADSKASEYAGIWENMDDEAKSVVCKDDDETAFDTKKFKAAIKSGNLATDGVESINAIQRAIAEEKALRKKVKEIATVLEDKAKKKVESLSEDEINDLLERKWIAPIIAAINRVGEGVPMQFVTDFNALEKKYADPLSELSEKIEKTNSELKASLSALTGNNVDMTAVQMLLEEL